MRVAALVLILWAAPAALAQDTSSARRVLDTCIETLGAEVVGLEDMEEPCPGIAQALQQLGIVPLFPETQHDLLTRNGLVNLRTLSDRYAQPPEHTQISVDGLQPVLAALREPVEAGHQSSWYERLKRWLSEAFDRQEQQANPWLSRWLDEHPISDRVQRALVNGVMLLVVLLAITILLNEVRAVRAGRRKREPAGSDVTGGVLMPGVSADAASFGERPAAMLKMLVATLVKTGRLHGAPSLTAGELTTRARFDDSAQRESFRSVAQLADREVFGGKDLAGGDIDDAVRAARSLDEQLRGAAT
ncbi:DUF4129 domain-containing protein [Steroidobacter sp.]|uniref:DUF4129 domain-containing protein n=1 Tax=Steroidobacter sp. TaxID=1978227 RepID=UPI001A4EBEF4|nr:DUF4129 domain-containing protein [Steroidobacter sp.]MBL8266219.1 hypothetical protein [Steroidobacter sp.]